ncbi:hypothetical protein [Pengzhenrongella frigida]|uniref:Uncharacterized protein n=1 Tax=Pengzhenrongella frigida TaxID=1259133 RepID=A0A4Q5N437_9MICO|nr:hypothetical protein [Cellulomonas sp. HLT2-17]RYV52053.1 hypothetical protein EUA98_05665 [Cellulomonas sp. HLT2-17]
MADRQHDATGPITHLPPFTPEQAARAVEHDLAVVLVERVDLEHVRRRALFNLPAAARAERRARDAGKAVRVVLVRLEPVGVVVSDD